MNPTQKQEPNNTMAKTDKTAGRCFVYEIELVNGEKRIYNLKNPPQCGEPFVILSELNGIERVLITRNLISISLLNAPTATSNLIGLDGRPVDAIKPIVFGN